MKGGINVNYFMSQEEQQRRKTLAEHARSMIASVLPVEDQDETSLTAPYQGYYMQVSFSQLHPLVVISLAKAIKHPGSAKKQRLVNRLNLTSVLGSHAINQEVGCYAYRSTHWLDAELDESRFQEILDRCAEEADRGYDMLKSG